MESSLNLNTLATSLPAQQNAEKELLNDFKAAALSITTLYRSSRKNAKRAYNAGYATACQDLLNFIQHGVSTSDNSELGFPPNAATSTTGVETGGMTIGRVMDWTEARLDAIKSTEEDEDEDEEREKENERAGRNGSRGASSSSTTAAVSQAAGGVKPALSKKPAVNAAASTSRIIPTTSLTSAATLPTPCSPLQLHRNSNNSNTGMQHPPEQPSSPSPPPLRTLHAQHRAKLRTPSKADSLMAAPFTAGAPTNSNTTASPNATAPPITASSDGSAAFGHPAGTHQAQTGLGLGPGMGTTEAQVPLNMNIGAGAKRRHAMMMMMGAAAAADGGQSVVNGAGMAGANGAAGDVFQRRRTRSTRGPIISVSSPGGASEDMDVEEEGRERKRVARR